MAEVVEDLSEALAFSDVLQKTGLLQNHEHFIKLFMRSSTF